MARFVFFTDLSIVEGASSENNIHVIDHIQLQTISFFVYQKVLPNFEFNKGGKKFRDVHKKTAQRRRFLSNSVAQKNSVNTIRRETYDTRQNQRSQSCLAYKKYILLTKNLLTALKAVRQMFKSNKDPPLALEAELSN
jgi:hypothetical protein